MFGISLKPFIVLGLIIAMWSLALLWIAFSRDDAQIDIEHAPGANLEISICHLTTEGDVAPTMILRDTLATHYAHGDYPPDENGDCVFDDEADEKRIAASLP